MKKVLYSALYAEDGFPFQGLAERVQVVGRAHDMIEPDSILVLWGGADIDPALYGHRESKTTYTSEYRDNAEWKMLQMAMAMGIPIIGVCRGAQMLCAAAGGFLIQDVTRHAGYNHTCKTYDNQIFNVNSIHHQMMAGLEGVDHTLLAWSEHNRSQHYLIQDDMVYNPPAGWREPEMVDFPAIKGLAIQWHPEAMQENCAATEFILKEFKERYVS